jgi:hypothetical protein
MHVTKMPNNVDEMNMSNHKKSEQKKLIITYLIQAINDRHGQNRTDACNQDTKRCFMK